MRHWVIVVALAACGGKSTATEQPHQAAGPSCAEVGVHAAPMFHADDATTDRIAAAFAGHCDIDRWSLAVRVCAIEAKDHDSLHECSYKLMTREQADKVTASLTPLVSAPAAPSVDEMAEPPVTASRGGTQAEIAARSADEGQALFAQGKYAEASSRYQDAVARVPEARYFYGLAQSKFREGKLSEALTACNAAEKVGANAALAVKIRELRTTITAEAKKQDIKLN